MPRAPFSLRILCAAALLGLSACGGSGGGAGFVFSAPAGTNGPATPQTPETPAAPQTPEVPAGPETPAAPRALGVELRGFIGDQVVLRNGSDEITLDEDGSYSFATPLAVGASYAVSVRSQPGTLTRSCTVSDGSGTMPASGTVGVSVVCSAPPVRYAYASLVGSNQIAGWSIDAADGHATSAVTTVSSGLYPIALTADPAGRFLYTLNFLSGTIDIWQIGLAGSLGKVGTTTLGGIGQSGLVIEPRGRFLYVVSRDTNEVLKYAVDPVQGTLSDRTTVMLAGPRPNAMTVDPSGRHLYVASQDANWVESFAIDQATGEITVMPGGPVSTGLTPMALATDPKGRFVYSYDSDGMTVSVLRRDRVTGALVAASSEPVAGRGYSLAVEPGGRMLHAIGATPSNIGSFTIDAVTGALAGAGTLAEGGVGFNRVAMDPNGLFMLVSAEGPGQVYGYSVNPATGAAAKAAWPNLSVGPSPSAVVLTR